MCAAFPHSASSFISNGRSQNEARLGNKQECGYPVGLRVDRQVYGPMVKHCLGTSGNKENRITNNSSRPGMC